jgi:hypothetical protein
MTLQWALKSAARKLRLLQHSVKLDLLNVQNGIMSVRRLQLGTVMGFLYTQATEMSDTGIVKYGEGMESYMLLKPPKPPVSAGVCCNSRVFKVQDIQF